ncbi:MAG: alpha/beta hydrolase [Bacteroidales bacterium]|nr:alpha/beta hydrolase [Bacteroidales bacterium]
MIRFINSIRISSAFICLLLVANIAFAQEKVQFRAWDKVVVTADLYAPHAATAPFIVLFHQANYSRGEYVETAPKLNNLGFNCLAVDLRSGEECNGVINETWKYADSLKMETRYTDAYSDIQAAMSYVKRKYPNARIIILGSSYSASLAIKYAGDYPKGISGVVAFSPGEYFSKFGWNRDIIQKSAANVRCPVFITSTPMEKESWQKIYNAIPVSSKTSFLPSSGGKHGSKALWSDFPESKEYWTALQKFLARFK